MKDEKSALLEEIEKNVPSPWPHFMDPSKNLCTQEVTQYNNQYKMKIMEKKKSEYIIQ